MGLIQLQIGTPAISVKVFKGDPSAPTVHPAPPKGERRPFINHIGISIGLTRVFANSAVFHSEKVLA